MKNCQTCGKQLSDSNISSYCQEHYRQKQNEDKIRIWKETGNTQCAVQTTLRNCIRKYIEDKQNHCCAICEIPDVWNDQPLHLIQDHIDGDAANNKEENLRQICPNCDSQQPTFKSRNKNSARTHRLT